MNVVEQIFNQAAHDQTALICGKSSISYGQLGQLVESAATELDKRLPATALRVGLRCHDGPRYVTLALAIIRSGRCLAPVPRELTVPEVDQLKHNAALDALLDVQDAGHLLEDLPLADCTIHSLSPEPPAWDAGFRALNPAFIRFSSGTTGERKGVVLSHNSLRERIIASNDLQEIGRNDKVLWVLPMSHHFAVTIMLYLWHQSAIVLSESHLPADMFECARDNEVTVLYASPYHYRMLAAAASPGLSSVRLAVSTAAALGSDVADSFYRASGVAVSQALGVIEIGLPIINTENPLGRPDSVGRPQPQYQVEICDDSGNAVPPETAGQLRVKGPGMLDAYLSPWAAREQILDDGWFATGDLAKVDQDGFLTILGRANSVINVGGMKVFPEEVERVLLRHPGVSEARVVPIPHAQFGALPVAEIVPCNPSEIPANSQLNEFCRKQLASYKLPCEFRIKEQLPHTLSGKILRKES